MEKILTPMSDFGLQIPGLPGTLLALMFSDPPLLIPIPAGRFNLATIRTGREGFQTQINAHLLSARGRRFVRDVSDEIHIPAFARILAKTATFDRAGEFTAVPEAEGMTAITYRVINDFDARRFEWNPSRRPFAAPAQPTFFKLLSARGVLLAHGLNSLRMQPQFLTASRS